MDEKKFRSTEGAQKLTDKEVEAVNGGIKIVIFEKPKLIRTILQLLFKIKRK